MIHSFIKSDKHIICIHSFHINSIFYPFSASSLMLRLKNCYMYTLYECKFFKDYESNIDIAICTINVTIVIVSLFWISVLLHGYNISFLSVYSNILNDFKNRKNRSTITFLPSRKMEKHNYALKYNLLHNNGKHNLCSPKEHKKDAFAKKAQMVFIRLCKSV